MVKYMNLKEFVDLGLLQEVNRQFLHPMGLALEVTEGEDGSVALTGVWDCRDDPDGVIFSNDILESDAARKKHDKVVKLFVSKKESREKTLGYFIQPIPVKEPKDE